ncbi:MAG: aldehyde dehydrogenase family protein, partial [Candidatus Eremiobacteraeota bacterium]|nr:aldehyde dehydrogenase family protein [Candidatus Eremiobacteraeota bacterium]
MTMTAPRTIAPFRNEPIRDFSDPADKRSMEDALTRVRATLGKRWPLVIDGRKVEGRRTIASLNPAKPSEVVGEVDEASAEQVSQALDAATARFATWKHTTAEERADFLFRAAARIRATKDAWNALLVYEVGKPWIEADADTA